MHNEVRELLNEQNTMFCTCGFSRRRSRTLSTDRTFTGQKADGASLLYMKARTYDPALGMFLSPDTVVPDAGVVVDYNRFMYARGNPLKYVDPTGHWTEEELAQQFGKNWYEILFGKGGLFYGNEMFLNFLRSENTTGAFNLGVVWTAVQIARGANQIGLQSPDAIALRLSGNGKLIGGPGGAAEAVVNFHSGELSYFGAFGVGAGIDGGVSADAGASLIYDLPSNSAYRGWFGSVKVDAKFYAGITLEPFVGLPLPEFPSGNIGAHGAFVGVGGGVQGGLTVNLSYYVEMARVDVTSGFRWLPDVTHYSPLRDAGEAIYQAYWGVGKLLLGPVWDKYGWYP
jgi:RHS repeat-associated protein